MIRSFILALHVSFILILHYSTLIHGLESDTKRRLNEDGEVIDFSPRRSTIGGKTRDLQYNKVQAIFEKCRIEPCQRGFICGNNQFYNVSRHHTTRMNWIMQHTHNTESSSDPLTISCTFLEKPVSIMVISSWISDQPLDSKRLNHYQYCNLHNYSYSHLSLTREQYDKLQQPEGHPTGWSSVEYVYDLMKKYPNVDYFVKLDIDCLFTRTDLFLETIIDPFEQYSFYVTQIEESRFIQSHTWIIKNDYFGRTFIQKWLEFRFKSSCGNLAQEQGALNLLIGRFMKDAYHDQTTNYNCDNDCYKKKSVYHHHHCVLDWYTDNNMSVAGEWIHPKIYLYPFFEHQKTLISPDDGFNAQVGHNHGRRADDFQPFTLHPCKVDPYVSPEKLLLDYKHYCK
eukprot:gene6760-7284_t